jgi:4-amino-4-deoxychorismate lyase
LLINGTPAQVIEAADRGLQYGDGLFETLAVVDGRPCLWKPHMNRLRSGCERMGIECPDESLLLRESLAEIDSEQHGILKIIVTRGAGQRGYRPPVPSNPNRILDCTPWPVHLDTRSDPGVEVRLCSLRLGRNPVLAGMKTLNRIEQVLARSEWSDDRIAEGLMFDTEGYLIEGTASNLFLFLRGRLVTPDLTNCGIAGIMRGLVMEQAEKLGIPLSIQNLRLADLKAADGLFLTNSLIGIQPVAKVGDWTYGLEFMDTGLVKEVLSRGFGDEVH